jgi:two-component system chemotaxis sensor kinase CheA
VPEETRRAVADILGHAIRNAIDHGIEAPADRITRGKPAVGTISVRFQLDQRRVRVEIADDGRGIDLERVRRKAVEAGLISEIAAERAEPAELMELLFEPGFSTAGQVSAVSGRGVGMDVIRALAEERGGFASLTSQPGRGTTVVARLQLGEGRARAASTRVPVFR